MSGAWQVTGKCAGGTGPCTLRFVGTKRKEIESSTVDDVSFDCIFENAIGMQLNLRPYKTGKTTFTFRGDGDEAITVDVDESFVKDTTSFFRNDKLTWIILPTTPDYDWYDYSVVYKILDILGNAGKTVAVEWNGKTAELSAKGSTKSVRKFRKYCDAILR